jgi:hypothetical protein
MTLLNIADMLAEVLDFGDVYAGNIDGNLDRCIGVYNGRNGGKHKICIGGKACTKTKEKQISILIHFTDNPTLAESEAQRVLDILADLRNEPTEGGTVRCIQANEPQNVGRDERNICEYVIEGTVYYEENTESEE